MKKILLYTSLIISLFTIVPSLKAQTTISCPIDTIDGKLYYRYTVERSVGLYRVSVNFGVKQEDILSANPVLQKRGLRLGEEILVPIPNGVVEVQSKAQRQETPKKKSKDILVEVPQPLEDIVPIVNQDEDDVIAVIHDTLLVAIDSMQLDTMVTDSIVTRLAILLPFQTDAIKREKSIDRFYDFYAGALIAIYQAQAQGQALEVWSYDTGRTTRELNQVLSQSNLHQMDAIIGPAFSQQVSLLADSTLQDSLCMLIPFVSKVKEIHDHPYLLKFNPSELVEADTVARYLAQRKDSINCVILESREGDVIPSPIVALHEALKEYDVPQTQVSLRAVLSDSMDYALVPDVENIIIFNTEKYTNLQSVMPHLLAAADRFRITLFSHYSWQDETITLPQLYTSVFIPEPVVSEEYEELYRYYFNHELSSTHPRYDLLGYDLTRQLLQLLELAEKENMDLRDALLNHYWEGSLVNLRYLPVSEQGGLENNVVHIIHQ